MLHDSMKQGWIRAVIPERINSITLYAKRDDKVEDEIIPWIIEHIKDAWIVKYELSSYDKEGFSGYFKRVYYFSNLNEAILFKLTWC